jgi:hypothetical protein
VALDDPACPTKPDGSLSQDEQTRGRDDSRVSFGRAQTQLPPRVLFKSRTQPEQLLPSTRELVEHLRSGAWPAQAPLLRDLDTKALKLKLAAAGILPVTICIHPSRRADK